MEHTSSAEPYVRNVSTLHLLELKLCVRKPPIAIVDAAYLKAAYEGTLSIDNPKMANKQEPGGFL